MTTTTVGEAIETLAQSVSETNQAVTENFVEAQKRAIDFTRGAIEQGVNVLRENVEDARTLTKKFVEDGQVPQDVVQVALDIAASARERNAQYATQILEDGAKLLRSQIKSARQLAQTAIDQSQRHQQAYRELFFSTIESSLDLLTIPFSFAQDALEATESIALRGVDSAASVTKQGLETAQEVAQRGASAFEQVSNEAAHAAEEAQKIAHQPKQTAHKAAK
jgi:hypothetical protein